jgi:hypothetical protein
MQVAPRHRKSLAVSTRALVALLTTCAAWLVAFSQGAAMLHFALVSHEICADHGEVVHAGSTRHSASAFASGPAARAALDHAEHDHCPLLGRRAEHASLSGAPSATLSALAVGSSPPAAAATDIAPSRAELLLAAPKQSPPV